MGDNTKEYEHQLEVRKRDGKVYTIFVFSSGDGFVYSVYESNTRQVQSDSKFTSIDAAFQGGFEWIKARR